MSPSAESIDGDSENFEFNQYINDSKVKMNDVMSEKQV